MSHQQAAVPAVARENGPTISIKASNQQSSTILERMRNNGILMDITFYGSYASADGVPAGIRGHRPVLAAASDHLERLLTSVEFADSNQTVYTLEAVDHFVLAEIVKYIYAGELIIQRDGNAEESLKSILVGARYLLMFGLAVACDEQLASAFVDDENCVDQWKFACFHDCDNLKNAAALVIAQQFDVDDNSSINDQLNLLSIKDFKALLNSTAFTRFPADAKCFTAMAWRSANGNGGEKFTSELLGLFEMSSLSTAALLKVSEYTPFRSTGLPTLFEGLRARVAKNEQDIIRERETKLRSSRIYIVGGETGSGSYHKAMSCFDPNRREWEEVTFDIPWCRNSSGAASIVKNRLYVLGGNKDGRPTNTINVCNLWNAAMTDDAWSTSDERLAIRRYGHASVMLGDDELYVIGGKTDPQSVLDVVEKFVVSSDAVEDTEEDMTAGRHYPAAAAIDTDKFIVAGGSTGTSLGSGPCPSSIEAFNSSSNSWSTVGKLNSHSGIYGAGAVTMGDNVYVVGAVEKVAGTLTSQIEIFNSRTGQTKVYSGAAPAARRGGCSVAFGESVIFVCGGSGGNRAVVAEAGMLDIRSGEFTAVEDMPNPVFNASACLS